MEENKNIDGLFKSSLEKYELVPSANIWSSLDIELTQKQKANAGKRKRKWLLLLFLFLLLPTYLLLTPTTKHKGLDHKIISNTVNSEQLESSGNTSPQKSDKVLTTKTDSINNLKSNTTQNSHNSEIIKKLPANNKILNKSIANHSSNKNTNTIGNTKNGIIKKDYKAKKSKSNKVKLMAPLANGGVKNESKENIEKSHTTSFVDNIPINNDEKALKLNSPESVLVDSLFQTKAESELVLNGIKSDSKNILNIVNDSIQLVSANEPKKDTVKLVNLIADKGNETKENLADESMKLKKPDFKNSLYVDISLSPIYTYNFLRNNTSYTSADDAIDYRSREKSKFSFSTGMALRYDLNNKWSISLGAYYSTIAYSMALSTVYALKNSNDEVHFQYPTSWGTIEIPNQPGQTLKIGDSLIINSSCNQLIKVVNIPLLFRYTISSSSFSFYTNVGVSANFTVKEDAVIKTGSFEFSYTNSLIGKRKINCSLLLGFGMQYKFTNRLAIFIEPIYRASITSVTQDIPVNCYPQSFGLSTGLSIQLR